MKVPFKNYWPFVTESYNTPTMETTKYVPIKKDEEFAEALRPFENKWVAIVDDKVVAAGDSPEEVKRSAEQQGYEDFVFHLVPSFSKTLRL